MNFEYKKQDPNEKLTIIYTDENDAEKKLILETKIKKYLKCFDSASEVDCKKLSFYAIKKCLEFCGFMDTNGPPNYKDSITDLFYEYYYDFIDEHKYSTDDLFELISCTSIKYLNIPIMEQFFGKMIRMRLTGKTTEEMRTIFGVENDFTEEEEESIKKYFAIFSEYFQPEEKQSEPILNVRKPKKGQIEMLSETEKTGWENRGRRSQVVPSFNLIKH